MPKLWRTLSLALKIVIEKEVTQMMMKESRFKRQRFEALPEEAKFPWHLPEPLLECGTNILPNM